MGWSVGFGGRDSSGPSPGQLKVEFLLKFKSTNRFVDDDNDDDDDDDDDERKNIGKNEVYLK